MRANALSKAQLVLVGFTLLVPAPVVNATTRKAATPATPHASSSLKKAPAFAKTVAAAKPAPSKKQAHTVAVKPEKAGKHTAAAHTPAKPSAKPQTKLVSKPLPKSAAKARPIVEVAHTEPAVPLGPEPHVTHNRKVHLEPEAAPAETNAAPRKATPEDFMDTPPASIEAVPVERSDAAPASIVLKPHAEPKIPEPQEQPVITAKIEPQPFEPELYNNRGRLIMPPPLKGSHEILVRQNVNAEHDGLERIQDDQDLARMRQTKMLVALPAGPALQVDERLPYDRRYSRPWTAQFLADMARAHYAHFHTPLQVNSAVRTVDFQIKLIRTNGNAAPADGDTASPHLTGQAVDIAKKGLSLTEIAWMRGYLLPLVQQGKVDVEEEFQQSCFHISVYRRYVPEPAPKRIIVTHRPATSTLATVMP